MGTQEAIYFGIPLIGIPLFGDQSLNLQNMGRKNVAVNLGSLHNVTEENLYHALKNVLHDEKYKYVCFSLVKILFFPIYIIQGSREIIVHKCERNTIWFSWHRLRIEQDVWTLYFLFYKWLKRHLFRLQLFIFPLSLLFAVHIFLLYITNNVLSRCHFRLARHFYFPVFHRPSCFYLSYYHFDCEDFVFHHIAVVLLIF